MSSIIVHSFYPIPVLSATTLFKDVTLPPGSYELREIPNPFPGHVTDTGVTQPNWYITEFQGQTVGMTLQAWVTLNHEGNPLARIVEVRNYPSLARNAPCLK